MKRPVNIKSTFREIRKLPLEVSFEKIESWIIRQKIEPLQPLSWLGLTFGKFFNRSKN